LNDYFTGSVGQLIERARLLRAKVPRDLPRDYDTLAQACRDRLNDLLDRLRSLVEDPRFALPAYQPERLRRFKRAVGDLDIIETVGIAALDRATEDDHRLNALLERVTKEIRYPLVTPVVTSLSQQYFCIVADLNLLCVPLTEGRFLLHLPDLYHELAHPLLTERDDPVVEPFQEAHFKALGDALGYLAAEKRKEDRRRGPRQPAFTLTRWEVAWVKYWMVEFFCDLFAVYVLGPAFAWSHLHLTAKRGGDPFEVPLLGTSSHPADDARMRALLFGLEATGFTAEAAAVGARWQELLSHHDTEPEPEYYRCYPDELLRKVAAHALSGVRAIGCRLASPASADPIHAALNRAWDEFWKAPESYPEWEKTAVNALF
jgi:hypothetical protein